MELNQGMNYSYFVFLFLFFLIKCIAKKLYESIIQKTTTLTLSIHFCFNWQMQNGEVLYLFRFLFRKQSFMLKELTRLRGSNYSTMAWLASLADKCSFFIASVLSTNVCLPVRQLPQSNQNFFVKKVFKLLLTNQFCVFHSDFVTLR